MLKLLFRLLNRKAQKPDPGFVGSCSHCGKEVYSDQPISADVECATCYIQMNELDRQLAEEHKQIVARDQGDQKL